MNSYFIQQIIIYYNHYFYAQNDPGLPSESRLKLVPVSFWHIPYLSLNTSLLYGSDPNSFGTRDHFHGRQLFHGGWGWFGDDSSTWHLLCTLFLLLLHQLHLRPSGIRSQSLGTPALWNSKIFQAHLLLLCPSPKISHSSKEYFKVEIVFRSQGLRLGVHHEARLTDPLGGQSWETAVWMTQRFTSVPVSTTLSTEYHEFTPIPSVNSCCSITKSCLAHCNPKDYTKLGSSVLHRLSEFVQIHVHWVGDTI